MPLLVDGMNVIGSRPNGWWRDRDNAMRTLVEQLVTLGEALTVVFDGRPIAGLAAGTYSGVTVVYAERSGPNGADDRIVALLDGEPAPARWTVITSDRVLRDRVRARGAEVAGASALLARLAPQP